MAKIKNIQSIDEIPPAAPYVLVMSGISTYDTVHARGATFVVNDGLLNPARSADKAFALTKARQFADQHRVPLIYVLE